MINIFDKLFPSYGGKIVTDSKYIRDAVKNKNLEDVVKDIDDELAHQQSEISALDSGNYVTVTAESGDTSVSDIMTREGVTPAADTIYRVGAWDGTQYDSTAYSEYSWNQDDGYKFIAAHTERGIDSEPTAGSTNLVTSGGVFDNMGALDVSELNATENPTHTLAEYATLDAALAAIPSDYQKGGMSIKFVQNSDNKYVQYRLMAYEFTTDTTQWTICDKGVYVNNQEYLYTKLDKKGQIMYGIKVNGDFYFGIGCPQQVKDYIKFRQYEIINLLEGKVDKVPGKELSSNDFTDLDKILVRIDSLIDSPDFLSATVDKNGQIMESLKPNGDKCFYGDVFDQKGKLASEKTVHDIVSSSLGFIDKRNVSYDNTSGLTNPSFYLITYEESFKAGDTIAVDLTSDTWQGIEWVMLYDVTNSQQLYLWQGAAKKDGSYYITLSVNTNAIAVRYRVNAGYAINLTSVFSTKSWVYSEEIMDDKIERKVGEAGEIDLRGLQVNGDPEDGHVIVGIDSQGATEPYSVAVGYSNMTNNSGSKCVAIGVQNLRSNSGIGNVAIGYHSLFRNTNAGNNTGVGGESLDDNISGNNNTAVGGYALQRNNLGSYNVAIGGYALNGNSPDTQGPGSGYDAGGHVVNVSKSVAVGYKALHNSSNETTGDGSTGDHDNIAIGYEASVNLRGKSNTIAIGSNVEPTKSNQVIIGNPSIEEFVLGNKKIIFNLDGSVSWQNIN